MQRLKVFVAGTIAIFIWGAIPVMVKLTLESIPVSQYLFIRFGIGALISLPWLKTSLRNPSRISPWLWLALFFDLAANYYFQTLAMEGLPASWYIVIFALNPILALVLLRIPFDRRLAGGVLVATLGTLLFIRFGELKVPVKLPLVFCLVVGMLTWVLYTLIISKFQKFYSDVEITAITQVLSFLSMLVLWLGTGAPLESLYGTSLWGVLFLGFCTPAAYFLFSYALRRVPSFGIASQYMEPVFGVLMAFIVFGERLSYLQMVGAIGIVGATVAISKEAKL